jgi:hypothetical protein
MIEFLVFMGVILLISLSLGLVFWFIWITLGFIGLKETVDRHYKYGFDEWRRATQQLGPNQPGC